MEAVKAAGAANRYKVARKQYAVRKKNEAI
jgi:hypothetical protein